MLPMPARPLAEHIASARAARAHAERLMLRMPDVTPLRLASANPPLQRPTTPVANVARNDRPASAWDGMVARIASLASVIFAVRVHRSSVHGS